jgi:hypothetical protein
MPRFGAMLDEQLQATGTVSVLLTIPWAEHAFDAVTGGPARNSRSITRNVSLPGAVRTVTGATRSAARGAGRCGDTPHGVADVVGNEQRAASIERDTHRATIGLAIDAQESGQHIDGSPAGCRR